MKLTIELHNLENIDPTPDQVEKYEEIIAALITTGGLDGVKAGQTIIHFDMNGDFMGVQTSYWPFRRRQRTL